VTGSPSPPAGFKDHFSRDSSAYARFRPRYPAELFRWLATLPARRDLAWDCATGSGQAATMVAPHFRRVAASDASVAQLRAADRAPRVHYFAATGEAGALAPASVDLVTVAQAFHWLHHAPFFAEIDRVLAPGGAVAIWCYSVLHATPEIDALLKGFYDGTIGRYWPPERVHVDRGYRDYRIPIAEAPAPAFAVEGMLTMAQFLGYIRTWSAVGRYLMAHGQDPVDGFAEALAPLWGAPEVPRRIVWPLHVRAGRWLGAAAA
jgi:SAM-dependent methyltransferase